MASDTRSIPYGVIRGETKPQKSNEVIRSSHVADVTGVMQRVRTREHKSEWSRTTRLWWVTIMMMMTMIIHVLVKLCNDDSLDILVQHNVKKPC